MQCIEKSPTTFFKCHFYEQSPLFPIQDLSLASPSLDLSGFLTLVKQNNNKKQSLFSHNYLLKNIYGEQVNGGMSYSVVLVNNVQYSYKPKIIKY